VPRGAKLTPEVEDLISKVCIEHPEWLAKPSQIQQEVIRQLPDSLKTWGGDNWPGIDVIKDRLRKKLRPKLENIPPESKRLDEPWSIGASVKHGIPPEASKDLFDIWRFSLAMDRPISIRQAKWIVHIRNLFYPISTGNVYSDKVNRNLWLIRQSWLYSIMERVSEIEEKHFDTTDLDAASFMPNWERTTASKLGKVSSINYSQEALAKLEKQGTSLTSPSVSVKSVEQAVWYSTRSEPPPHLEIMGLGTTDEVLPEEDDLVAAYWLMHLSKGPLWNKLPSRPEVVKIRLKRRQMREQGHFIPDSGGYPDDSLYSRQLAIRNRLLEWVKKHHSMSIRDYHTLTEQHPALVLSPKLLTAVGYEVPTEDLKLYAKLHENELKQEHLGWNALPADVQQRFIHDEQTDDDLTLLEDADNQEKVKRKQLEEEFIELVQHQGGVPVCKSRKEKETFWKSIRDEWIKRYPSYAKNELWYPQPEEFEYEYERLIKERNLNNKSSDSIKGGTT
jgi:hypothetical protein